MVFSRFLRYCGNEGITIDKITPLLVQKFLHTRPSNCNYNAHRRELSALFEYARKSLGIIPNNPVSALERMPEERGEKKIPTQEEFIKLVNAAQGHERHLILVLAYTAARIDEVYRMKWEDVNFEQGWIRLWTRKTNDGTYRDRKIPMRDYMKGLMRHLWETRTQDQYVFPSPKTGGKWIRSEMMKKICNRAGIPHYGFHCIRHFVASMLLDREKVGTPTVSKLLGHTNLLTTDIYAHSIGVHLQDDALGSAMDRLEATFTPKFLPATSSGLSDN
jgi:integrase